ncbi:hypothetical protein ABMA27_009956 [Loxostege sticticalis]|uniref:Odorant receptor n=1 Tax=Loxostege sticticalis TaxID=481309 RepID=A0ABR3H742_LOXSC
MSEELIFDKSLQNIKFIFRLSGLNIDHKKRTFKQNCIYLFNLLWHQTDLLSALSWVLCGMFTGKVFTELTFVAPCSVFGILADTKGVLFILQERKIYGLMNNLRDLEIKAKDFVGTSRDSLIKPDIYLLDIVIKVLNILNGLMIVVFDMCPPIFIAIKYFTTGQLELMLPFLDVYFFDGFDLRYWPFLYAHQVWSVCVSLLEICATDYFFFTCCTHIRIQFKLLQHQFQDILTNRSITADSTNQMPIQARFRELVKWHQGIIISVTTLEAIYSKASLSNFLASSLIICLTGFNVTAAANNTLVVTFIVFLFMSLLQIFFLCLFGDLLMQSSTDITDAVYNSRWYRCDVVMQKNMLMVQTRAQNSCKLTAAGFADVNLRAFMKIMSTSWSYFALLQTIYGSRETR